MHDSVRDRSKQNFLNLILSFRRLQCMLVTEIAVKRTFNSNISFEGHSASVSEIIVNRIKLTFVFLLARAAR